MASALRLRLVVGDAVRPRRLEWPRKAEDDDDLLSDDAADGRRAATGARAVTDAMLRSVASRRGTEERSMGGVVAEGEIVDRARWFLPPEAAWFVLY